MRYKFKREDGIYTRSEILNHLAEKYWSLKKCDVMPDKLNHILNKMVVDGEVVLVEIGESA